MLIKILEVHNSERKSSAFVMLRTRAQWLTAFRLAIEHSGELQRYQRQLLEKRQIARAEEKEKVDEESIRATNLDEQLQNEKQVFVQCIYSLMVVSAIITKAYAEALVNNSKSIYDENKVFSELQARAHAEEKAETLARQRAIDGDKMKELEKIREQLEILLEEERQAKKDEEIVRTLQARILNEEWARRETLERLQEEQRMMLEAERKKREEFEQLQSEKEHQLKGL